MRREATQTLHLNPGECPMGLCSLRDSWHRHELCAVCGGIHLEGEEPCIVEEEVRWVTFEGMCPFLFCLITGRHKHPVCGTCGSVRYGNTSCEECKAHRRPAAPPLAGRSLEKL